MKRCLVAVLVVLCVSGCGANAGPPSAADPPTTVVTSVSPTGPVAPEMPAAARERTKAGAIAFARYYWTVVDYAQSSLETARLRQVEGGDCVACAGGRRWIAEIGRRGGVIRGGAHRVTAVEAHREQLRGLGFILFIRQVTSPQVVSGAGALDRRYPGGPGHVVMHIAWLASGWRVSSWDTAD